MRGREWPWFSSLRWWQKGLFGVVFGVALLAFILLPRNLAVYWLVTAYAALLAFSLLRLSGWQIALLTTVASVALTAVLIRTELIAPYGPIAVGGAAFALSFVLGWRAVSTRSRPRS